ncbi:hypothetical protein [Paraburkholderia monticola]|uniref:hypothetical protein n=1 Tax=Paraburkholderia monticola TaxID=1399968 RepID=UPI0012902AC5|nr:hypothetical protein [Paraburkholderia monticola]
MKKIFILVVLFIFSGLTFACGSDIQREKMAEKLYADDDMRKFACAADSCSKQEFEQALQFNRYEQSFHGKKLQVCLVEPTLSATNSYTGVFVTQGNDFEFQFISYGTGVKVGVNKVGVPMIIEGGFSDPDNPDNSVNQYLWNGSAFIFSRNVPRRN